MKNSRTRKILIAAIAVIALAAVLAVLNSFEFNPHSSDASTFMARAQQKSAAGIKVNASALGASESLRFFGENLARYNIQPVWLSIENQTDDQLALIPIAMDPDYYSPYEVAYRFHGLMSFAANRARDEFFLSHQIASILPAHSTTTGFVYGVSDAGIKYAHIVIAGRKRLETFDFALPVPGPKFVGTDIGADTLYPGKKIEDLDLGSLRATFAKQICCTSNAEGTRNGDPLNLVIIESRQSPIVPFISRGWHLARQLDFASAIETARAFVFRDEFLTSPVSPL